MIYSKVILGYLGAASKDLYKKVFDNSVLVSIPRNRDEVSNRCPNIYGVDIWRCYELSWLDYLGKPNMKLLSITVDASSQNIVESKSLKLYLNSFNNRKFSSIAEVQNIISSDLRGILKCDKIIVNIQDKFDNDYYEREKFDIIDNECVEIEHYLPNNKLLRQYDDEITIEEKLASNLFRSNCPVTNQPDWAQIRMHYIGYKICRKSLLQYLISFRNHNGFHENCIEKIFHDMNYRMKLKYLKIKGVFLRRGGISIIPIRSTYCEDVVR